MHEIKFRLWDKSLNKWASVMNQLINRVDKEKYYAFTQNDRFIYQQYTNLKDKNNKDIYEGDIVKQYGDFGVEYNSEVYYFEGKFSPLVKVEYGYNTIDSYNPENFEIIGNIFENKNLIKE